MESIYLKNFRMHAYHGVLPQECIVGNDYVINLRVDYPFAKACLTDDLAFTMNYQEAAQIVEEEMLRPAKLLESVAFRIIQSIFTRFPLAENVAVDIQKTAPPMSFDLEGAGVTMRLSRSEAEAITAL